MPPLPPVPPLPHPPARGRPLPDAIAADGLPVSGLPVSVRRVELPQAAPPYDGQLPCAQAAVAPPGGDQAAETPPAETPPADAPPADPLSAGAVPGGDQLNGWPGQFAQALAEALAGARPACQVVPWTTEQARRRIRQLGPLLQAGSRPRVRRVRTFVPHSGALEMTVIVGVGQRVRALAVRLEQAGGEQGRWVCTAIEAA